MYVDPCLQAAHSKTKSNDTENFLMRLHTKTSYTNVCLVLIVNMGVMVRGPYTFVHIPCACYVCKYIIPDN